MTGSLTPARSPAESDVNDSGSDMMFAESRENDMGEGVVVAAVAEIDEDESDEGTT